MKKDRLVEIKNLTIKNSEGKVLVNSISLNLYDGEFAGIVGESGSGKTITAKTIVNILPNGLSYTAEKFEVLGKNYLTASEKEKRFFVGKNIGLVPQNTSHALHPMLKIKDQIIDGYLHYYNCGRNAAVWQAHKKLERVGFEEPEKIMELYPWQLSGGMRQRVNVALSIITEPKIIIADEPTSALDSTAQKHVADLYRSINEGGGTILLISHDLGIIRNYCDRVIIMYAGQILEVGSAADIFEHPMHPYTKALIKVIPSRNIKKGERLAEISGSAAEAGRMLKGCAFRDRCPEVMDKCAESVNEIIKGRHYCKCNLYD